MARYYNVDNQQYISQYTPTNIDYSPYLIEQEKKHNQPSLGSDVPKIFDIKVDPHDIPMLQQKQQEYFDKRNKISDELNTTKNTQKAARDIYNLNSSLLQDSFLKIAPENYKKIEEAKKQADLLEQDNAAHNITLHNYYGKDPKEHPLNWNGTITNDGEINMFNAPAGYKNQDPRKPLEEMLDNKVATEYGNYVPTEAGYLDKRSGKYLTKEQLLPLIQKGLPDYLSSGVYTGELTRRAKFQGLKSPNDILNPLIESVINERTQGSTDRSLSNDPNFDRKKKEEEINKTSNTQSEGINRGTKELKDYNFDSKGNVIVNKDKYVPSTGAGFSSAGTDVGTFEKLSLEEQKIEQDKSNKELLNLGKQYNIKGTPKEIQENYNKAIKDYKNRSISLESISGEAAKNIADGIIRNKTQRHFTLQDSKGTTEDGTLETVLNKLDISEEEFDKQLEKGISGYTQQGPTPGSFYAEIKNSDGKTRRIMISQDEPQKNIFSTSYLMKQAENNLQETIIQAPSLPGYYIKTTPKVVNGKFEFIHEGGSLDNQGNFIKEEDINLNNIMKKERENFEKSNYLGSKVTILKPHTTQ